MKRQLTFALLMSALFVTPTIAAPIVVSTTPSIISVMTFNPSTTGESANPWLLTENLLGLTSGTLRFSNDDGSVLQGSAAGIAQTEGKFFLVTVTNNTAVPWTSFELELRVDPAFASSDTDGLSFAQGNPLTFLSSRFSTLTRIDDTRDYLNFSGGTVGVNETVSFFLAISDNLANNPFYLVETANKVDSASTAAVPEPGTLSLVGLVLAGLASRRRRHQIAADLR
jgi:hypothetical protein